MARIILNLPLMSISGSLSKSDKYSYVTRNGKTFTRCKGTRTAPVSHNELAARQHFKRATEWANMVQHNDELFLHYHRLWPESPIKCKTFRGWLIKYYYTHFKNS